MRDTCVCVPVPSPLGEVAGSLPRTRCDESYPYRPCVTASPQASSMSSPGSGIVIAP